MERILNAVARVGDNVDFSANPACGKPVASDIATQETLSFYCGGPLKGRYVSIQLENRQDYLQLCEVKIMVPGR